MIQQLMQKLGCSEEEAKAILEADKAIDRGENVSFDLDENQEKIAKSYVKSAAKGKKRAVNLKKYPEKEKIIAQIADFLIQNGHENVQIVNISRQISFKMGENDYEITLIQKRKP